MKEGKEVKLMEKGRSSFVVIFLFYCMSAVWILWGKKCLFISNVFRISTERKHMGATNVHHGVGAILEYITKEGRG